MIGKDWKAGGVANLLQDVGLFQTCFKHILSSESITITRDSFQFMVGTDCGCVCVVLRGGEETEES
jgi:hypothetical protein